jgi:hypothetical protein
MPLPALTSGTWSWLQYPDRPVPAAPLPVTGADATADLPDLPPALREGWLSLTLDGQPTALTYTLAPLSVAVTTDPDDRVTATLRLTAYNGSGADVNCGRIAFELPAGDGPTSLVPAPVDPATLATSGPKGWTVTAVAGTDTLTVTAVPTAAATVTAGQTVTFTVAGVRVNAEPGIVTVPLSETTDAARAGALTLTKFRAPAAVPTGPGGRP